MLALAASAMARLRLNAALLVCRLASLPSFRSPFKLLTRCLIVLDTDESVLTMDIMDQTRYSNEFRYPDALESVRADA